MVVGAQPTPPIGLLGSEPRSATLQSAPGDSVPAAPVRRAGEARQPSKDRAARLGCACKVGRISPEEHIVKELEVFPSICVHLKLCSSRQRIRRKRTSCRGPGERGAPWMQQLGPAGLKEWRERCCVRSVAELQGGGGDLGELR